MEFGKQNQNVETYVVRPGGVLEGEKGAALLGCVLPTISVRMLGAAMVDLAINGGVKEVLQNKDIVERGRELLMKQNS